jgi:L-fuconolactonase
MAAATFVRRSIFGTVAAIGALLCMPLAAAPLPFKLVDGHSHLVSGDLAKYPQTPATAPTSTAALPGMGFRQFGTGRPTPEAEAILGWMDREGVEGLVAVQKRGAYGLDNSYILDSARSHPNRFFPVAVLDAEDPKTPGLVGSLAKSNDLAGIRLTGVMAKDGSFPWLSSERALATWRAAAESGIAVEIMTQPFGHPEKAVAEYARLAAQFPKVKIVLDHLAWPAAMGAPSYGIDGDIAGLRAHKNIYYKFTTINMDKLQDNGISSAAFLRHAVAVFGADHIMWGSDTGNTPGGYHQMVERALAAAALLAPREKKWVLRDTALTVFAPRMR